MSQTDGTILWEGVCEQATLSSIQKSLWQHSWLQIHLLPFKSISEVPCRQNEWHWANKGVLWREVLIIAVSHPGTARACWHCSGHAVCTATRTIHIICHKQHESLNRNSLSYNGNLRQLIQWWNKFGNNEFQIATSFKAPMLKRVRTHRRLDSRYFWSQLHSFYWFQLYLKKLQRGRSPKMHYFSPTRGNTEKQPCRGIVRTLLGFWFKEIYWDWNG